MAKLNESGNIILKSKRQKFVNGQNFAIAFLGDSHIGRTDCKCGTNCPEDRYTTLLKKIRNMKGIYTIIHGGDASDYGNNVLNKFVSDTKKILKYNSTTVKDEDKTPLFANIGNHDYKLGKAPSKGVDINDYHKLIGKDNAIVKLFGSVKGPKVAIVLLNTGYSNSGQLTNGLKFEDQLNDLAKRMGDIIKKHSSVRFIIDMHIPPRIPNQLTGTHVLNPAFNNAFRRFLKKHPARILAIVTHHKHGNVQSTAYHYIFTNNGKKYNIPVYLTAQGGHCDPTKGSAQYSFYRMDLVKSGAPYKINAVYRYDMVWDSTKKTYVLNKKIPIK